MQLADMCFAPMQVLSALAPTVVEYVPALHAEQTDHCKQRTKEGELCQRWESAHRFQCALLISWAVPWHAPSEAAPVFVEYLPATQFSQVFF